MFKNQVGKIFLLKIKRGEKKRRTHWNCRDGTWSNAKQCKKKQRKEKDRSLAHTHKKNKFGTREKYPKEVRMRENVGIYQCGWGKATFPFAFYSFFSAGSPAHFPARFVFCFKNNFLTVKKLYSSHILVRWLEREERNKPFRNRTPAVGKKPTLCGITKR